MADVKAWVDLLAWVEDVVWVKGVFTLFEYFEHLLGVHEVEVRSADDAVIVFTTDVSLKLDGGVVEGIGHFFYQGRSGLVGEIKERVEVEVSVATVTMHCC